MSYVEEDLMGKAKIVFQILYEREWIKPSIPPSHQIMKGKEDKFGNHNTSLSIRNLISTCTKFHGTTNLTPRLLYTTWCRLQQTPPDHCKIVGDGIEFDWGCSKIVYRFKPMAMKRNKI